MILTYTLRHTTDRTPPVTVPDIDPAETTVNERLDALEAVVLKIMLLLRYMDDNINMLADVVDLIMETPAPIYAPDSAGHPPADPEQGATVGPRHQPHPTATDLALGRNPELRGTHADPVAGQ